MFLNNIYVCWLYQEGDRLGKKKNWERASRHLRILRMISLSYYYLKSAFANFTSSPGSSFPDKWRFETTSAMVPWAKEGVCVIGNRCSPDGFGKPRGPGSRHKRPGCSCELGGPTVICLLCTPCVSENRPQELTAPTQNPRNYSSVVSLQGARSLHRWAATIKVTEHRCVSRGLSRWRTSSQLHGEHQTFCSPFPGAVAGCLKAYLSLMQTGKKEPLTRWDAASYIFKNIMHFICRETSCISEVYITSNLRGNWERKNYFYSWNITFYYYCRTLEARELK